MLQLDERRKNTSKCCGCTSISAANARGNWFRIFAPKIIRLGTISDFVQPKNAANVSGFSKNLIFELTVLNKFVNNIQFLNFFVQSYLKLKIYMNLFLAATVSGLYQGVGNDATKALFNFGFCFTVAIAFMYNPLMPVLLTCKWGQLADHNQLSLIILHAILNEFIIYRCSSIGNWAGKTWTF